MSGPFRKGDEPETWGTVITDIEEETRYAPG